MQYRECQAQFVEIYKEMNRDGHPGRLLGRVDIVWVSAEYREPGHVHFTLSDISKGTEMVSGG